MSARSPSAIAARAKRPALATWRRITVAIEIALKGETNYGAQNPSRVTSRAASCAARIAGDPDQRRSTAAAAGGASLHPLARPPLGTVLDDHRIFARRDRRRRRSRSGPLTGTGVPGMGPKVYGTRLWRRGSGRDRLRWDPKFSPSPPASMPASG